eukprot:gene38887-44083_t
MFSRSVYSARQFGPAIRRMSTQPSSTNPPKNPTVKNAITALALFGFVGAVYYTSIAKIKEGDDFSKIIEEEAEKVSNSET